MAEYLLFHFGSKAEMMTYEDGPVNALNFPQSCADISAAALNSNSVNNEATRVLDLGCAVGGSSFHLAPHFDEVVGVDFSKHFVDAAQKMKDEGEMEYDILQQGGIFTKAVAKVPAGDFSKVSFQQGDGCNLDKKLG